MRNASLSLLVGSSLLLSLAVACGDDGGTGGNGGSGGTGGTGTSTQTTGVTGPTSTGTGGAPMCDGAPAGPVCGPCLEQNCCQELADAGDTLFQDQTLVDCALTACDPQCLTDAFPELGCAAPADLPMAGACAGAHNDCNPVTQEGCDTANGAACDVGAGKFVCYGDGNTVDLCGECGTGDSDFCVAGHTCGASQTATVASCYRFCCVDADCGDGGTCVTNVFLQDPGVGVCTGGSMGQGGGGQGGGGGGGQGGGGQGGAGGMMGSGGQGGM